MPQNIPNLLRTHKTSKMAPRKNTGKGKAKASGAGKKSKSPPKTPPRERVICPGCSSELSLHKTLSDSNEFVYATKTDMKKLGIECKNESCPLYIEGVEDADDKQPVNPTIEKCLEKAKAEHAAAKVVEMQKRAEEKAAAKKVKRDEKAAAYAPYNAFSGAKEKEAEEGIERKKQQDIETEMIVKGWEKIQKAAEELEELEKRGKKSSSDEE